MSLWSCLFPHTLNQWIELLWDLLQALRPQERGKQITSSLLMTWSYSSALWLQRKLHCPNYCQKHLISIMSKPKILFWAAAYFVVLVCSRLNKSSYTYLANAWGARPSGLLTGKQLQSLPATVLNQDPRRTGGWIDGPFALVASSWSAISWSLDVARLWVSGCVWFLCQKAFYEVAWPSVTLLS